MANGYCVNEVSEDWLIYKMQETSSVDEAVEELVQGWKDAAKKFHEKFGPRGQTPESRAFVFSKAFMDKTAPESSLFYTEGEWDENRETIEVPTKFICSVCGGEMEQHTPEGKEGELWHHVSHSQSSRLSCPMAYCDIKRDTQAVVQKKGIWSRFGRKWKGIDNMLPFEVDAE
jgi:hypothetical protein